MRLNFSRYFSQPDFRVSYEESVVLDVAFLSRQTPSGNASNLAHGIQQYQKAPARDLPFPDTVKAKTRDRASIFERAIQEQLQRNGTATTTAQCSADEIRQLTGQHEDEPTYREHQKNSPKTWP